MAVGEQAQAQLALRMWLRESATFDNFVEGSNGVLLQSLKQLGDEGERFVYVWGPDGEGKSHLLQAACHAVTDAGGVGVYLPLNEPSLAPEILDGLEHMSLVAVDNIEAIAGDRAWETALFNLYNLIRDQGRGVLVVAGQPPLAGLGLQLADLQSRLAWGLVFQLQPLSDGQKLSVLQQRADGRGFELSDDVGHYLLRHCSRDMAGLFNLLDRLDHESLAQQRRLTVPFVKSVIASDVS